MSSKLIVIVGVGALGSHLAMLLRNHEGTLRLVDFDRVEQKNVLSQFHGRPSVGKSKVQALQGVMQLLFGVRAEIIPHKLTSDNVQQLLGDAELVVDCLDNGASRRVVQRFVRKAGVLCLHGALDANGSFGRAVWDEDFEIDDEAAEGAATCENGEHLPFIAITSGYLAQAAQVFVKNGAKISFHSHPGGADRV